MTTTNRKIAKVSAILIAASVLGHIFSLGKEIVVAQFFGINAGMDAYNAALSVSNFIGNIVQSTLFVIFIPVYIKLKSQDTQKADRVISSIASWFIGIMAVLAVIMIALSGPIINLGFHGLPPQVRLMSIKLLVMCSFSVFLYSMVSLATGILNAREHFVWPAFSQMFITAFTIAFVVFFADRIGVFSLVYGLIAGLALQAAVLFFVLKKMGFRYGFTLDWRDPEIIKTFKLSCVFLIGVIAGQANLMVDQMMTSYLPPGSVAVLGYASKFIQAPLLVFAMPLATAVFPFFVNQINEQKYDALKYSLARSIRMAGFIFLPMTVLMILFAKPAVQLLFQYGKFDTRATELIALTVVCYSFQLLFITGVTIIHRMFFAMQGIWVLVKISFVTVVLNAGLNYLFMKTIIPPVAGIALSTSVMYVVSFCLLYYILGKRLGELPGKYIIKGLGEITAVSVVMGVFAYFTYYLAEICWTPASVVGRGCLLAVPIMLSLLLFAGLAHVFKFDEYQSLALMIREKTAPFLKKAASAELRAGT